MTAWAVSVIDGDGTPGLIVNRVRQAGPFRPRVGLYGSYVVLIDSGVDGRPTKPWCLVRLGDDVDPVAADADPGVWVISTDDLDTVLTQANASVVNNRLASAGVVTRVTAGMTIRQVLVALATELGDPTWGPVG